MSKMYAYVVYRNNKEINTVFFALPETRRSDRITYVRDSLVSHDGYNPSITVKEVVS